MSTNWGDNVDNEPLESSSKPETVTQTALPPPQTIVDGDEKRIIEYFRENGKIMKKTKLYRTETRIIKSSKSMLRRRGLAKFGQASKDGPGPDPGTTGIGDEVYLKLSAKKNLEEEKQDNDLKAQLVGKRLTCRYCKGDHWTTKCPYKDTLSLQNKDGEEAVGVCGKDGDDNGPAAGSGPVSGGRYLPPSMRNGGDRRGASMMERDDTATMRVTNLPENTREDDLRMLCRPFGPVQRVYLATDRETGAARGFAFVTYHRREDAGKAIAALNGYGYDHLILACEWAKPSPPRP